MGEFAREAISFLAVIMVLVPVLVLIESFPWEVFNWDMMLIGGAIYVAGLMALFFLASKPRLMGGKER